VEGEGLGVTWVVATREWDGSYVLQTEPFGRTFRKKPYANPDTFEILYKREGDDLVQYEKVIGKPNPTVYRTPLGTFNRVEYNCIFLKGTSGQTPITTPSVTIKDRSENKYAFDCGNQPSREAFNKCLMNL